MVNLAAICCGFVLDLLLGDPPRWPHMVVAMGKLITKLETALRRIFPPRKGGELLGGALLVLLLLTFSYGAAWGLLYLAGVLHPVLALATEALLCWQCLALRSLGQGGNAVRQALEQGDIPKAREAVGCIVGRDTAALDEAGIIRATVETVAENTADGVIAPLLYMLIGGAPLAVAYKAINTMDSMLGYRNPRYNYFGRCAARVDDVANFIPARLTGLLMIIAAPCAGLNGRKAATVFMRDRLRHHSPNSAHAEAACAGALGISLGGGSYYGGRYVPKPVIGDNLRLPQAPDIGHAIVLLYYSSLFALIIGLVVKICL